MSGLTTNCKLSRHVKTLPFHLSDFMPLPRLYAEVFLFPVYSNHRISPPSRTTLGRIIATISSPNHAVGAGQPTGWQPDDIPRGPLRHGWRAADIDIGYWSAMSYRQARGCQVSRGVHAVTARSRSRTYSGASGPAMSRNPL